MLVFAVSFIAMKTNSSIESFDDHSMFLIPYFLVWTSTAKDVVLEDDSYDAALFTVVGATTTKWATIAAGTNVTFSIVVTPLFTAYYNFTSATVAYTTEDGEVLVSSISSFDSCEFYLIDVQSRG